MSEDTPLKRLVPEPDTSRNEHIHNAGPLYLEDVEAIHDILSRVSKGDPTNDIRVESYRSRLETYNQIMELKQSPDSSILESVPAMAPPEEPALRPVVSMESDEFEIPDLKQLRKIPYTELPKFRMRIRRPWIWVSGSEGAYHISIDDVNESDALQAFNQILGIITTRQRPWLTLLYVPAKTYLITVLALLVLAVVIHYWSGNAWIPIGLSMLNFAYVLVVGLDNFYLSKRRPTVITVYKRDAPDFWKRNRDTIVVGLVIAVVTAISTALLT